MRDVSPRGSGAGASGSETAAVNINTEGMAAASVHDARQSAIVVTPSGQQGQ
jgi:hypothetical protein